MKQRGLFQRDGTWWICYFQDGKRHREKAGTLANAKRLYMIRKAAVLEGRKLPTRRAPVLFRELLNDALEDARAHCNSWRTHESRAKFVLAWFGERAAESITPQELDRRLTEAAQNRSWKPSTVNRTKALVSLAYSLGMRNGKMQTNPARLVRGRREDNARLRFLSAEEESTLRATIPPGFLPEFDIALYTGLRLGEQYALTRDCVNLERKLLTVPRSKNGRPRHVPLNARPLAAFTWLLGSHGDANVFQRRRMAARSYAPRWFKRAVAKAGIEDFSWHNLRHTFASRLVMAGIDIRTVQELLGHRTIQMTMRYAHLAPDHQRAAVDVLDKPTATRTATEVEAQSVKVQ
jgi:integrase